MIQSPMPQDIFKFKPKFALNLTARKCVCYGLGLLFGTGAFILSIPKGGITEIGFLNSVIFAIAAFPFFLWGAFEPYGVPLEKIAIPFIVDNILAPAIRPNEIHFGEIEKETRYATKIKTRKKKKSKKEKEEMATPSKEYKAIL